MRLSIIIPYYNREKLLMNVINSIRKYRKSDIEIIIVDDGSDKPIDNIPDVIIIRLEKKNKLWRGASIAINTGVRSSTGDVILINSAECMHAGDILDYLFKNFVSNCYICFSTFMASDKNIDINNLNLDIPWWSTNSRMQVHLPYCAAISKENFNILGGYDERFKDGFGFDDCDFVHRIKNLGLRIIDVDNPYVIHQYHEKTNYSNTKNLDLFNKLNREQPKRIKANVAS